MRIKLSVCKKSKELESANFGKMRLLVMNVNINIIS